jgi:3-dehydroquinate synthase
MSLSDLTIKSKLKNYDVILLDNSEYFFEITENLENVIYLIDFNVYNLYVEKLFSNINKDNLILINAVEENKTLSYIGKLYNNIIKYSPKKNMTIVAIGGGIIQDISGFFASTIYRGVKWIYIPTTLLAQCDSCIGGKTSLNFKNYKNLIGTFYAPNKIFIYTDFITTLSIIDYFSGVGELAKLHIIGGKKYINILFENIKDGNIDNRKINELIFNSLQIKKGYIEKDEFDNGLRNILNYGHSFGHAIESATNFLIPHGQAVVIGMIIENIVSKNRIILSEQISQEIFHNILIKILKIEIKNIKFDKTKIIEAMKKDKKRSGRDLTVILLKDNYEFEKNDSITEKEALKAIEEFLEIFN